MAEREGLAERTRNELISLGCDKARAADVSLDLELDPSRIKPVLGSPASGGEGGRPDRNCDYVTVRPHDCSTTFGHRERNRPGGHSDDRRKVTQNFLGERCQLATVGDHAKPGTDQLVEGPTMVGASPSRRVPRARRPGGAHLCRHLTVQTTKGCRSHGISTRQR